MTYQRGLQTICVLGVKMIKMVPRRRRRMLFLVDASFTRAGRLWRRCVWVRTWRHECKWVSWKLIVARQVIRLLRIIIRCAGVRRSTGSTVGERWRHWWQPRGKGRILVHEVLSVINHWSSCVWCRGREINVAPFVSCENFEIKKDFSRKFDENYLHVA